MNTPTLKTRANRVNTDLARLGTTYHDSLPLVALDEILTTHGFQPLSDGIYTGQDGQSNEAVGENYYLAFAWHRMASNRWEVIAYLHR
jgi:hypothetical protein